VRLVKDESVSPRPPDVSQGLIFAGRDVRQDTAAKNFPTELTK